MSNLKVLYLTRGYGDYLLGVVNPVSRFAEPLIVLPEKDDWVADHLVEGVRCVRSKAPRVRHPGNILLSYRIDRIIRDFLPDVIHLQNRLVWEALPLKAHPGIPFVVTAHDVIRHPRRGRFLPQYLLDYLPKRADGIIVHGDRLVETARDYYGIEERRIASIPIGVTTKYGIGSARGEPKNLGVLLFGSLDQWKGIEYLVKAEPLLRSLVPDAKIVIAGNSKHPDYYRNLVNGADIDLRLGFQNDDAVRELFRWADVLVLPYIEASQSAVLQLGFGFGVPPVVTDVGGLPDVVRNERNGLVVPPKDPEALARALARMLTDLDFRKKVIDAVVHDRETRLSEETIARSTVDFYEKVIALRREKRG